MPKFTSIRTFNLGFLGEEWKDCFIRFSSVSINESKALVTTKLSSKSAVEVMNITMKFLTDHFISASVYDSESKQIVSIKPEQLGELPALIQNKAVLFLVGDAS